MVEVELGTIRHAEFFHNATRWCVSNSGNGDDFKETKLVEREVDDCTSAFGGKTLALKRVSETPSDFYCRLRKVRNRISHGLHANDSRERAGFAMLGREHRETIAVELHVVASHRLVGFSSGHGCSEVSHHDGVSIYVSERRAVAILPGPEDEARGSELEGNCQLRRRY